MAAFIATYGPWLLAAITFALGLAVQAKFPLLSALARKYPNLADEMEILKKKLADLEDYLDGEDDPPKVEASASAWSVQVTAPQPDPLLALREQYVGRAMKKAEEEFASKAAALFKE